MRTLLRLSRPIHLLLAALTFCLGVSVADYLGNPFRADSFWFGMLAVILSQMSMNLLFEVFRLDVEPLAENEIRRERLILRNNALYVAIAGLSVNAVIAFLLFQNGHLSFSGFVFILLSLMIVVAHSLPPFRNRGFGEFLLAAHLAYVIPSIGFLLQADETHRFLVILFPLTLLALSYFIVMDFPTFATDRKFNRNTLLTRLGWERAVPLHHIFVLFAYAFFAIIPVLNISLSLIWPAFLTLPFAVFQVYQLRNISLGAPVVNWILITATALAVFGLSVYFLTLTFWLR